MQLLRDPIWQFIGVLVALLIVFIPLIALLSPFIDGLFVLVILFVFAIVYPKLRPKKTLFFHVLSDVIVLSVKEEIKGKVEILHNGLQVWDDIHLVTVCLWNGGSDLILPEDYKGKAIKLNLGKDAQVLNAQISQSKPSSIKEEIEDEELLSMAGGNVLLQPMLLTPDNSLTIQALVTRFQDAVSTDETRVIIGGYIRDWNKSSYNTAKRLVEKAFSPWMIFIVSIYITATFFSFVYTSTTAYTKQFSWPDNLIFIVLPIICGLVYMLTAKALQKLILQVYDAQLPKDLSLRSF